MNKFTKSAIFSFIFATAVVAEETPNVTVENIDENVNVRVTTLNDHDAKKAIKEFTLQLLKESLRANPNDFNFTVEKINDTNFICAEHKSELNISCVDENIVTAMVQARLDYLKEQKLEDSAEKTA